MEIAIFTESKVRSKEDVMFLEGSKWALRDFEFEGLIIYSLTKY